MVLPTLRNSTLLCFVLAVTSQQQKRFVDLLTVRRLDTSREYYGMEEEIKC